MKAQEFKEALQQIAREMKLAKNIFTAATAEQLEYVASLCSVETYSWETAKASFLLKDGKVKDARLFNNNEEINIYANSIDIEALYEDFRTKGKAC